MEQRNRQAMRLALRAYLREMRRYPIQTFLSMFLPGIGTILVFYVPPLLIAQILSRFQNAEVLSLSDLLPYVLGFSGLWLLGEAFWRVGLHFSIVVVEKNLRNLYMDALNDLVEKDLRFFHENFAGSLTKKALGYARRFEDFSDAFIFNIVPNLLPLPFIGYVLWQFSPWLITALLAMLVVSVFVIMPLIRKRQKLVAIREDASNVVAGHLADVIANIDAVKAFAHEDHEQKQHAENVRDFMAKTRRSWDFQNRRVDIAIAPLYVLTNAVGLIVAILASNTTEADVSAIFLTFSYFAGVTRVMWEFNRIYRNLEGALSDAAQFTALLLEAPQVTDPVKPSKLRVTKGEIRFRDVDFHYADAEDQALFEKLNMTIKSGEKVGLVGHSGGGKTTITRLLLRFMDIQGGAITIDGQNIAEVSQADVRSAIAYVPQDPLMFHRSLRDNIRYGRLDAPEAAVRKAAKSAHAEEFIAHLPDGYDTLVGERGVKLSGGQRQRVAIARAMIKDAPILVLDEATSALDSASESLIQDALWKLMEGRTAIVIAHRLSTIQKMDRIIVMDNGRIAEQGTHKELLARDGIYANLWKHQSGGFLED